MWPSAAAETAGSESELNPLNHSTHRLTVASAAPPSMTTAGHKDTDTDKQNDRQMDRLDDV